jgi:hypothetical protein
MLLVFEPEQPGGRPDHKYSYGDTPPETVVEITVVCPISIVCTENAGVVATGILVETVISTKE